MQSVHEPVLLHEVVENLVTARQLADGLPITNNQSPLLRSSFEGQATIIWYLDGTLGGAGHALAIAKAVAKKDQKLNIIGLDRDEQAIERAKETLKANQVILECQSFRNLDKVLEKHGIGEVDLILFDLGISSDELDNSGRGFSFQKNEPLLMTMGDPKNYQFTARDILNNWDEAVIADIIFGYGEERFARRIARNVINYRAKKPIESTDELVEIVKMSVPGFYKRSKINPATKTFQALRIAVNDELVALKEGLKKGYEKLSKGGRMAVISFHSLEDRIVKDFYKEKAKQGAILITKKPITPTAQEIAENPRSRSAKLRLIEKR